MPLQKREHLKNGNGFIQLYRPKGVIDNDVVEFLDRADQLTNQDIIEFCSGRQRHRSFTAGKNTAQNDASGITIDGDGDATSLLLRQAFQKRKNEIRRLKER